LVARHDLGGFLLGRSLVAVRRLVTATAVEAALLAIVLVLGGHLGQWFETELLARFPPRIFAIGRWCGLLAPPAELLEQQFGVLPLDCDRDRGVLLQLFRLQTVRQVLALLIPNLEILVGL